MRIIDLRSDTVTKPTAEMRHAMANADVGDDVYGDDPTVIQLETAAAQLLNKEAALFVPSGTFGNQLALLTHCKRGDEVILDDGCHIVQHECGAAAVIPGVQLRTIETETGQMSLPVVESRIRKAEDLHYPHTGLICVENAHSNGRTLPIAYMEEISKLAKQYKIPVHLDGARLFNAAEYLRVEPHVIADCVDTVMFCLSKGLCAPVGSLLLGTEEFIQIARKNRKLMGGGMRQVGILAAAGLEALEMRHRLKKDHKHARLLGKWLGQIEGVTVLPKPIQTNIVFCNITLAPPLTPESFVQRLAKDGILANPPEDGVMRFVTHNDVRESDMRRAVDVVRSVLTRDFW